MKEAWKEQITPSYVFDLDKLKWMNGMYLRNMSLEEFHNLVKPYYSSITREIDELELSHVLQPRLEVLNDIEESIDFINDVHPFNPEIYRHKKMKTTPENSLEALKIMLPLLEEYNEYDNDEKLQALFVDTAKTNELKNGRIMWPVRVALTNKSFTPGGAVEIAHILGKEETLRRIRTAIEQLENMEATL